MSGSSNSSGNLFDSKSMFGQMSTPFGAQTGGFSLFAKKPAFGGFGSSSPSQSSPFSSSTFQPIQCDSVFCSTSPFGASSQPTFGASSTPTFGPTRTPAFGATGIPPFGSTSPSIFRNTGSSVGASSSSAFGVSTTSSTPAFGASTAFAFGSPSVPSFGQSTSTVGSTTFSSISSPFGGRKSAFGAPTSTPVYGSPGGGSRIAPYSSTTEVDTQPAGKLESISAMPQYKDKSHEELRWEDYQRWDKGGPNPSGQVPIEASFTTAQPNHFWTGTFGGRVGNPFSPPSPLAMKSSGLASSSGFGSSSSIFSSSFSGVPSNPFGSTMSTPPFGSSTTAFGSSSAPVFGVTISPTFSAPSFSSASMPGGLTIWITQPAGLFQSCTPSIGQTTHVFGQPNIGFQQTTSAFGPSPFNMPTTFTGGVFSSSTLPTFSSSNVVGFSQPPAPNCLSSLQVSLSILHL